MKHAPSPAPAAALVTAMLLAIGCSQSPDVANRTGTDQNGATATAEHRTANNVDVNRYEAIPQTASDKSKDRMVTSTNDGRMTSSSGMGSNPSETTVVNTSNAHPVDNSGQNKVDRNGSTMTPMDQGSSEVDVGITRSIRKALTGDDRLSTNARNLKVITSNGVVVLRGPVASQAEAELVRGHVRSVAGITRTEDQITVP